MSRTGILKSLMSPVRTGAMVLMAACIGAGLVSGAAAADDNPYGLIDAKVISVGTMGDAKPYAFTQADGTFTGFDIELFRNVASRLGFKPDQVIFTGQEFSALMPSVANERFDVAVAAIGTTEARKKTVDFSDGYLAGYLSVLTSDKAITSAEGLKGKRLGVAGHAPGNLRGEELCRNRSRQIPRQQFRRFGAQQRNRRRAFPRLRGRQGLWRSLSEPEDRGQYSFL